MLRDIKKALRISSSAFDDDVTDLIDAGKSDLRLAGIYFVEEANEFPLGIDPLIKRAIIIYCKANFGYDNPEAERFEKSYIMLKQHLSLAGDYHKPME